MGRDAPLQQLLLLLLLLLLLHRATPQDFAFSPSEQYKEGCCVIEIHFVHRVCLVWADCSHIVEDFSANRPHLFDHTAYTYTPFYPAPAKRGPSWKHVLYG